MKLLFICFLNLSPFYSFAQSKPGDGQVSENLKQSSQLLRELKEFKGSEEMIKYGRELVKLSKSKQAYIFSNETMRRLEELLNKTLGEDSMIGLRKFSYDEAGPQLRGIIARLTNSIDTHRESLQKELKINADKKIVFDFQSYKIIPNETYLKIVKALEKIEESEIK